MDLPKGVKRQTKHLADGRAVAYYYWRATNERLPDPEVKPEKFTAAVERCAAGHSSKVATGRAPRSGPLPGSIGAMVLERKRDRPVYERLSAKTRAAYEYDFARLAKANPQFLEVRLDELQRADMKRLHHKISKEGLGGTKRASGPAPSYANRIVLALSALYDYAITEAEIEIRNPCLGIKLNDGGSHKRWPEDRIIFALNHLPERFAKGVIMGAFTGNRAEDCVALEWPNYDGRILRIVQRKTGETVDLPVYLFPEFKALLDQWFAEQRKRDGNVVPLPGRDTILRKKNAEPWPHEVSYETSMGKAFDKLPELDGFVLHGLRHSFVAMALEAGASRDEIKRWTGQRSDGMIELYGKEAESSRLAIGLGKKLATAFGNRLLGTKWEPATKPLKQQVF